MKAVLKRIYHSLPRPPSTQYIFHVPPKNAKIVCADIEAGPGVDLVADAHDMHMVPDNSIDCVISVSTLERVRYPQRVVKEILRILKPGGVVYVSVPFVFPFHSDPYDNYRFSAHGTRIQCEDFDCIESGFKRGPASTTCHLLVRFNSILFSFNSKTLYGIKVDLFTWLLLWMKYLDKFLGRYSMAKVIHAGAYFVGRKPAKDGGR